MDFFSHPTSNDSKDFMPKLIGIWPTSWGLGAQRWWTFVGNHDIMILCFWEPQLKWMDMENPTNLKPHGHSTICPMATSTEWREWTVMQPLEVERTSVSAALVDPVAWVNAENGRKFRTIFSSKKQKWAVSKGQHEVDTLIHVDTFILVISENDHSLWIERSWFRTASSHIKSEGWGENTLPLRQKHGLGMDFWDQSRPLGMAIKSGQLLWLAPMKNPIKSPIVAINPYKSPYIGGILVVD